MATHCSTSCFYMPQHCSDDLKARISVLFFDYDLDVPKICKYLGIKKTLVYSVLHCCSAGIPITHINCTGRPHTLNVIDEQYISSLIEHHPCLYLDKIQNALFKAWGIQISIYLLHCTLQRLDVSWKVVSVKALE